MPQLGPQPTRGDKRVYDAVTHGLTGYPAAIAWADYIRKVEAGWVAMVELALRLASQQILDDSDHSRTVEQANELIEEGKKGRKDAREECFRIVREDAAAALELRKQQAETSKLMVTLLARMCDAFEGYARTSALRTSIYEAEAEASVCAYPYPQELPCTHPTAPFAPVSPSSMDIAEPAPVSDEEPVVPENSPSTDEDSEMDQC